MKLIALLPILLIGMSAPQNPTVLEVTINQVRSTKGQILLSVYSDPAQYPYKPFRTCPVSKDSLKNGQVKTVILGLQPGTYAMGLLDDENLSGDMECNIIVIPKEGFGFSNNPRTILSKPDYDKLIFNVGPGTTRIDITVQYKLRK